MPGQFRRDKRCVRPAFVGATAGGVQALTFTDNAVNNIFSVCVR